MSNFIKLNEENIVNVDFINNIKFHSGNINVITDFDEFINFLKMQEIKTYGMITSSDKEFVDRIEKAEDIYSMSVFINYLQNTGKPVSKHITTLRINTMDIYLRNNEVITFVYIESRNDFLYEKYSTMKYTSVQDIVAKNNEYTNVRNLIEEVILNGSKVNGRCVCLQDAERR